MDAPTLLSAEEYAFGTVRRRSYVGSEGCTNFVVSGGVCVGHGAKKKLYARVKDAQIMPSKESVS